MPSPEETVARMTEAQKRVVLSLPADGDFGRADNHKTARYMWYGIGKGRRTRLVEHQYRTDNSWMLNSHGQAVRALLEKKP